MKAVFVNYFDGVAWRGHAQLAGAVLHSRKECSDPSPARDVAHAYWIVYFKYISIWLFSFDMHGRRGFEMPRPARVDVMVSVETPKTLASR